MNSDPNVDVFRAQFLAVIGCVFLILLIIELIRRKKLKEQYSLLWFGAGIVISIFAVWRDLLDRVAYFFGIGYPPALLFLVAFFFGMLLMIHFSVVISELTEKNKTLAQEVALLKNELKKLKS